MSRLQTNTIVSVLGTAIAILLLLLSPHDLRPLAAIAMIDYLERGSNCLARKHYTTPCFFHKLLRSL